MMVYWKDNDVVFIGSEQATGTLDGRQGSFADGVATASVAVVSNSGGFAALQGVGRYVALLIVAGGHPCTLEYDR